MYLMCVSLNYHQLPIELREKFSFSADEIPKANRLLNAEKSILENLLISNLCGSGPGSYGSLLH